MLVAIRETSPLRSAFSFTLSLLVHGSVLAWVALGPLIPKSRPDNAYDELIRPHETKIVWYNLRERLPDITPAKQDARPPRALRRAPQTLVAGPADNQRPPQLIWTPAPEIETRPMLPAPNVVALTPPARPVRTFSEPVRTAQAEAPAVALPDAPRLATADPKPIVLPAPARPQPRAFTPPVEKRPVANQALPSAPELTIAADSNRSTAAALLPPMQSARRTFIPPAQATHAPVEQPANLQAAPVLESTTAAGAPVLPGVAVARAVRPFAAPSAAAAAPAAQTINLPGAPAVESRTTSERTALLEMTAPARPVRAFKAPAAKIAPAPGRAGIADAPVVAASALPNLAIVGLSPTRQIEIPAPSASQAAGFSAGPQPRRDGGDSAPESKPLTVPGLFTRGGAQDQQPTLVAAIEPPTSRRNLDTAIHAARVEPHGPETGLAPARSASVPDPRMSGRVVYTIAIQMPNITSYSGSWIVWFAEREPLPGQQPLMMEPPLPLRKVDPKYITAALDEKIEGKVRLAAVIRRDGHVERVELLQHLDDRLDQSSLEALARWEFTPARRNGVPIDIDAVFEIPFHLAPKVPK